MMAANLKHFSVMCKNVVAFMSCFSMYRLQNAANGVLRRFFNFLVMLPLKSGAIACHIIKIAVTL